MRHHYDLPTKFFALFLDQSMTYSCGIFSRGASSLEEAQETKLELVCTKLGLEPGQRVLDVGCGWGSFAIHAAERHGVEVVGITLSEPQAAEASRRVARPGRRGVGQPPVGQRPECGSREAPTSWQVPTWHRVGRWSISTCTRRRSWRRGARRRDWRVALLRARGCALEAGKLLLEAAGAGEGDV